MKDNDKNSYLRKYSYRLDDGHQNILNMRNAVVSYNRLMSSLGRLDLTIGKTQSIDTDNFTLNDMVEECRCQASLYDSEYIVLEDKEQAKINLDKLNRFIKRFGPWVEFDHEYHGLQILKDLRINV